MRNLFGPWHIQLGKAQLWCFADEGISNDLANYLTMALDPNAGNIFELMKSQIPKYEERIMELEDELDMILSGQNISIVELFHKVAIK